MHATTHFWKLERKKKKLYICIQLENKLVTCLSKSRMLGSSVRSMTFFQKSKICTSYQYFLFHQQWQFVFKRTLAIVLLLFINHILATFKSKPKQHICSHKASLSELNYDNDNYTNHNSACSLNYDMYEIMDQYWLPHIFKKHKNKFTFNSRSLSACLMQHPCTTGRHSVLYLHNVHLG